MNGLMKAVPGSDKGLKLDPRTKIFLFVLTTLITLGGVGGKAGVVLTPIICVLPVVLMAASNQAPKAAAYLILYLMCYSFEVDVLPELEGGWAILAIVVCGIISHFMPCVFMGYYLVTTTTVSEFVAAMERMHVPGAITVPMSVMFRFFPTVMEEMQSINDAMRMRGIRFAGGNIAKMIEYRLIPLMVCSVKIGEELSAAALTRGLGGSAKRTNICKIGFGFWDYFFLAASGIFIVGVVVLNIKM